MRAAHPKPDVAQIETALRAANLGVVLLDRHLRLRAVVGPVADLLPDMTDRLTPGSDWSELLAPQYDRAGGAVTVDRLQDGNILVFVRAAANLAVDEPRLSDAVEGATVGTWEWEVETGRLRVDDRWISMLGHTRASIGAINIGTLRALQHPADRAKMAGILARDAGHEVESFDEVFRMRHATGVWVWVQSRGRVLRRTNRGTPALMAGVHLDITLQKGFEQRLEQVLDGAQVGTWQFDEVTKSNQINARWAEMLGYTLQEVISRPGNFFADLLHPDDLPQIFAEQDGRMRSGSWNFDNEFRLAHKDGHWVWILSRGRVTEWSENGQPRLTSGVHIDISERKALAEALARERDLLSGLMDSSISGILALDATGCVNFVNREAETVLGRTAAFLMGKSCADDGWGLTDMDGRPLGVDTSPFYLAAGLGQVQRGIKLRLRLPDGTLRHLLVNAAPVHREGISARVVCAVMDITDAEAAEARLRAAMEKAEAGNRAKSAFLAKMSHEIRTPLNGVLGMADLLAATLTDAHQVAMLQTIQQSGAHLLGLLNDILDLAKIESGRIAVERLPFSPADLARTIEAMHGIAARRKGIELEVLCDPGCAYQRFGDPQRVEQVLHNLVGNAVKFTEAGSVRVVLAAKPDGPLVIDVVDTGIGMTAAQTDVVFEDFVQADDTVTRRFGGSGLGLPIVRNLVTLMEGTLRLDSVLGKGTRVRIALPLPLVPVPPVEQPERAQNLKRLRALVADDNGTNRVILRLMLSVLGMSFTLVEDGEQAVAHWEPDLYDILLLDISMPHRDGVSALQAIRLRAEAAGVSCPPALAVTANAMTHHVAEYALAGFAGCVAKPLQVDALATAIARAVAGPPRG